MQFEIGKLYSNTGYWSPFRIKPYGIKGWLDYSNWTQDRSFENNPTNLVLYIGTEPWYGIGILHKFYFNGEILYFHEKPFKKDLLKEYKIE